MLLWYYRGAADIETKSQRRKLILDKKILLRLLPAFEPATFPL